MLLLRQKKDKVSVLFGKVDLPLVSSFSKVDDERYPVRSIHGTVIGEIRLTVSYQEIDVIPLIEYNTLVRTDLPDVLADLHSSSRIQTTLQSSSTSWAVAARWKARWSIYAALLCVKAPSWTAYEIPRASRRDLVS